MSDKQRKLAEALGDAEFELAVAQHLPKKYRDKLDAAVAVTQPAIPGVLGVYSHPHNPEAEVKGITIHPDTVNAFGPENWRPSVWAHEFIHRSDPQLQHEDFPPALRSGDPRVKLLRGSP